MNRAWLIAKESVTQVDAYIVTATGMHEHLNIPLSDVASLLGEGTACYFFPSEWISFIDIALPEVSASLLPVVIPNSVEESLAEPIESVHWAIAGKRPSQEGKTAVAIIHRSHVENTVNMCKAAGITLDAMYPDVYLVPVLDEGWACWSNGSRMLVRQDVFHGFALKEAESENWFASLPVPEKTLLYGVGEGARPYAVKEWVESLQEEAPPINLLKGEFAPRLKRSDPNLLRKSLYALGGAVACYFLFLMIENIVLASRLHTLQAETLVLYQEVIPGATQATSPRVVIAREAQRAGSSDHTFFVLLTSLSQALSRSPGIVLTHLQYEGDQLSAVVEAKDFATLDAWTESFSGASLVFKQEGAEQENGHVTARIRLGS
ncbi:MAG: type II secretion system protein GspL [Gammaproteobacteria bacterium]